jgi:hypothetical protein
MLRVLRGRSGNIGAVHNVARGFVRLRTGVFAELQFNETEGIAILCVLENERGQTLCLCYAR